MKKVLQKIAEQSLKFMNVKNFIWVASLCGLPFFIHAAPYGSPPRPATENLNQVVQQIKTKVADLKYEFNNHESEIQTLQERIKTHELSIEQFRDQFASNIEEQKTHFEVLQSSTENKLDILNQTQKNLENLMRGTLSDMQLLKNQANDSVMALGSYKNKLTEIEQHIQQQSQQINNLETALRSILDALEIKDPTKNITSNSSSTNTYKVQSGDTLEKIARRKGISVQVLRDLNQLNNDKIVIGQTLKLP